MPRQDSAEGHCAARSRWILDTLSLMGVCSCLSGDKWVLHLLKCQCGEEISSAMHFYPSLPLDGGETMQGGVLGSSRIESASPTLINRNGKPQHIPLFSACLQISAGCHFTAPFRSLFSVLLSLFFSISSSPVHSSPAAIRSCSGIPADSKQLDQRQTTASWGASPRHENGA